MTGNPNASVATLIGSLTVLLTWGLKKLGVSINAEEAAGIATAAVAIVLYIGRAGVKASILDIWNGVAKPAPKKP
jgi:hypothetical protein